jgi:16S rRNA (cytidine1402-2'-O)-methyltransferase
VTVGRELTKQFEGVTTLAAEALPAWLAADPNRRRGEFALVVHGAPASESLADGALPPTARRVLDRLAAVLPTRDAAALAAELTGLPRNRLYAAALAARPSAAADPSGDERDADDPSEPCRTDGRADP